MAGDADIASIASLAADPGRARMLLALGDGRALPASALAGEAGVAASTASRHLALLLDAGLVSVEAHGRHRYYRLAGPETAELIETLARLAPPARVHTLRDATRAQAIRAARSCYDHLAGRLGVDLLDALLERGILASDDAGYRLTDPGRGELTAFGIDVAPATMRPLLRPCLDWSERRHHLAGALGAQLLARFLELGWLERMPAGRAVRVTDAGRTGFAETFGVRAEVRAAA